MIDLSPGGRLRRAAADGPIQIPGAPDALAGRLIETAGFPAAYLSGAALSAGVLALPDVGLLTLTELAQQTRYLTAAVEIPVVVDADTGFGDEAAVRRTVRELEAAGAAAVQLEDQRMPKRCGHLAGKTLVEPDEMCAKLRAAADARRDDQLVIIARTDARDVSGLDDAIRRARRYVESGADWIFPEALAGRDEFARLSESLDVPLVANMTEFGRGPLLSLDELTELGYAAVLYPVTLLRLAMRAIQSGLATLHTTGTQTSLLDRMQTRRELYELLRYEQSP